jgi:hypothetical protein
MGGVRRWVVFLILALATGALAACSTSRVTQSLRSSASQAPLVNATTEVPPGYTVPPATSSVPQDCQSGSVTVTASLSKPPPPICLHDGATLTAVFDKSAGGLGVPGPWGVPPLGVTPDGILTVSSTTQSGDRLTAVFATRTAGSATVSGYYDNECGAGETTPCTIPPLSTISLTVTVVSP